VDPKPGAPQHHDQGGEAMAVAIVAGLAHDGDDLINGRRIGGIAPALVTQGDPGAEPWRGRRRAAPAGSANQQQNRRPSSLFESWTITRSALPTARCRSQKRNSNVLALLVDQTTTLGARRASAGFVPLLEPAAA
jgi:hypothetical protein